MASDRVGFLYAKYKHAEPLAVNDNTTYTTDEGLFRLYSDEYSAIDALVLEAQIGGESAKVSVPLARHLRLLSDIYGYNAIKSLVDDMPVELRGVA